MLEVHDFYYSLLLLTYQSDYLWQMSKLIVSPSLTHTEGAFISVKEDELSKSSTLPQCCACSIFPPSPPFANAAAIF